MCSYFSQPGQHSDSPHLYCQRVPPAEVRTAQTVDVCLSPLHPRLGGRLPRHLPHSALHLQVLLHHHNHQHLLLLLIV